MNVAIIIPTLGRPHALAPLLQNLRQTTELRYRVCFVVDRDDRETWEALDGLARARDFFAIECDGTYPEKTNAGLRATDEPLVLPTADDVVFHSGWYETAVARFEDPAVQVVGTSDLTPATRGGRLATMPILRRSYIKDPGAAWGETGTVFNESLHHNFVDRVCWELALHRGVAVFEPGSIIEHRHHGWGTREADATDAKGNQQGWDADKALYERMKAEWTR